MDGTSGNYALLDRSVIGTLDLWNVRGRMPFKKYAVRRFSRIENDSMYLIVLMIRRFGSTVEVFRVEGKSLQSFRNDKVRDIYIEGGALIVSTKNGLLKVTA